MSTTGLYAIAVLIWGSTWLAIEYQLGVVPAEVSVFYRYVLAALVLFSWCVFKRIPLRFNLNAHTRFALLGLLMFSLNYLLTYQGQRFLTSALMSIAFSTMVWLNIINMRLFFGEKAGWPVLVGATLGIVGMTLMFAPAVQEITLEDDTVIGALLGVAATYLASLGNMASQLAHREKLPVMQSTAWGMAYGALFNGLIAFALGREFIFDPSPLYVGSLIYLALFGSVIAFVAYLTLLGRIGPAKAGYSTILSPLVALLLSALFEDMQFSWVMLVGMAMVLAGNYFVLSKRGRGLT
ncbi:MAG: DMT family transporter [Gammaproteobacteria bacterium]